MFCSWWPADPPQSVSTANYTDEKTPMRVNDRTGWSGGAQVDPPGAGVGTENGAIIVVV